MKRIHIIALSSIASIIAISVFSFLDYSKSKLTTNLAQYEDDANLVANLVHSQSRSLLLNDAFYLYGKNSEGNVYLSCTSEGDESPLRVEMTEKESGSLKTVAEKIFPSGDGDTFEGIRVVNELIYFETMDGSMTLVCSKFGNINGIVLDKGDHLYKVKKDWYEWLSARR
ncbi:MAG: hypothetical protein LBQ68_08790 [Clostridiales bacterium]|nr:hypothetical protein [Clostridiales bacterium]